ncbi:MAG TPA: response regulator transcription factor [Microlunatus sp.]|nr:response regulator transcription factor [Microlunatus sp.]
MPDPADLRVLVVDDEPLVRQGLRLILDGEPGLTVVGEAGDGAAALTAVGQLSPDVVCMDVRMPDIDGIRATEIIMSRPDPPKILIITTFASDDYVFAALRAGASGFVLKRATADELITAVRAVAVGDSLLYPTAVRELAQAQHRRESYAGPALTAREHQVLEAMAEGLSNAAIAGRLVLGVETVRTHVAAVLRKLGARDRTHAVVLAYAQGLVHLP